MTKQCVVVGAGHAGGRAVEALVKYKYEGSVVLIGAEQGLPLERPPLSKAYLENPIAESAPLIRDRQWYDDNEIALHLGNRAVAVNVNARTLTLADATELHWDSLILTTGGSVRRLNLDGDKLEGVHYLRSIADATALANALQAAKHVVVVGGGFIGLEAASIARKRTRVTVLEAGERIMGRAVAEELSQTVEQQFSENGLDISTGVAVTGFVGEQGQVVGCKLADGSQIAADCVIVGVGIEPELDLARDAGLEIDNGIIVDEYCRTSAENVYAAGDVTNFYHPVYERRLRLESWQNAQNQAIAAARNVSGEQFSYADIPWFWSDQLNFKIQVAGAADDWDTVEIRKDSETDLLLFQIKDESVVGLQSIGAIKEMRRARKLLEKPHRIDRDMLADSTIAIKDVIASALKAR